jgi:eukaryotic-like serine/threonine-protein kinase
MIGKCVNNYEILSLIGEGGMGAVYMARHPVIGRMAAIKVLHAELTHNQSLVTRFINEARAVNSLHHPNLIDIIDVGVMQDGTPYLMMEFLEGESLSAKLGRQNVLDVDEAMEVVEQIADALQAVHHEKIIHRDLKPENLFLLPDKNTHLGFRVKILDFGIAKLMGDQNHSPKTQTGIVMGTPAYMSPEQCRGINDAIDHRSDIYSLGVILFHMVCGRTPFVSEGMGDLLGMHIYSPAPSPLSLAPHLPQALVSVILKMLEKEPRLRFQSMAELHTALRAIPRGNASGSQSDPLAMAMSPTVLPVDAHNTTLSSSPRVTVSTEPMRPSKGRRTPIIVASLTILVAASAIGGLLLRTKTPPAAPAVSSPRTIPAPPVASPSPPVPPPAEPPPAVITLEIVTEPAGAKVLTEEKPSRLLGLTPYSGAFPRSDSSLKLRIEKQGFRVHTQEVSLAKNGTVKVTLVKSKSRQTPARDPDDAKEI